jgi:hypothetical protein
MRVSCPRRVITDKRFWNNEFWSTAPHGSSRKIGIGPRLNTERRRGATFPAPFDCISDPQIPPTRRFLDARRESRGGLAEFESEVVEVALRREVGFISPWNFPLILAITDAIPALLAGNAAVLKPIRRPASPRCGR